MQSTQRFRGTMLATAGIMILCAGAAWAEDGSPALPKGPGEKAAITLQRVAQTPNLGGGVSFQVNTIC